MRVDSKRQILNAISRQLQQAVDLPDVDVDGICYEDRRGQFSQMLEAVGGRCVVVADTDELNRQLDAMPTYRDAQKICSLVENVGTPNCDVDAFDDPHQLEDIEFAILPGHFGVAENGAVWITDTRVKHRAMYFIVQHLALVVAADQLVDNMHQAYDRIHENGASMGFESAGFGTFLSGPSKTADIEQSLVIGAQGPRSTTVFLLETS